MQGIKLMMNYIWGGMLIIGIIYGVFSGNMTGLTDAIIDSSKEAVSLGIAMAGIVAFWSGIMEMAQEAGIIGGMTRLISPAMKFLFPKIPEGHRAMDALSSNFVANILGLGWAATPAGLRAMKDLEQLEIERGNKEYFNENAGLPRTASNEMCTFLVMNISSLQLIPVNIIAYRSQYGSANPAGIIMPAIIATAINTTVAIIFCKLASNKKNK